MSFMYVQPRIVGNCEDGFETVYETDRTEFADRGNAISCGLENVGSDDFLVVTLRDGMLAAVGWMDQDKDDLEELRMIGEYLGIPLHP